MIVMKFGGTSVRDSVAVERLIRIVTEKSSQKTVVLVSALAGASDINISFVVPKGDLNAVVGSLHKEFFE